MQQAAINSRQENHDFISDLYKVSENTDRIANTVDGSADITSNSFAFASNVSVPASPTYNWEYFCNELEYE